jgi:nucleoside triphosphate pyrophosphatase
VRLLLASASPRRRALLEAAGLRFDVEPAGVDESVAPDIAPSEAARLLAERKALAVAAGKGDDVWVLGADTVVALVPQARGGGRARLLGKPGTPEEAAEMLRSLSDTRHQVVTGLCVVRCRDQTLRLDAETTWVTMRAISAAEIEAYVRSEEWRDKAGGYAIQGLGSRFVTRIEGSYSNVVGLPVAAVVELLTEAGFFQEPRRKSPG